MMLRMIPSRVALGLLAVFAATPAWAHHAMGGETPTNLWQGLLSGFAHPVIGLDHLAGRFLLPAAFVGAGLIAALWHVAGFDLPGAELGVALSVIVLGAIVLAGRHLTALPLAVLFALAGLLHGYALAESVVGAEPQPIMAYLAGFGLVQYALASAAMVLTRSLAARHGVLARAAVGCLALVIGLVHLGLAVV
jgi:urease accessory protein